MFATIAGLSLYIGSGLVMADDMKACNPNQNQRCTEFCQNHNGMKSCILDITTQSGTCTCEDGTSHSKS